MEVRCSICGGITVLTKVHKDYQTLAKNKESVFVCEKCNHRLVSQARNAFKEPKPM